MCVRRGGLLLLLLLVSRCPWLSLSLTILTLYRLGAGEDTEEVNMISIDDFQVERGISYLDILKIDAEGNDDKVRGCSNRAHILLNVMNIM